MPEHPVKAYKNLGFLTSPHARTVRILAEYLEPLRRFRNEKVLDTIVFFGSARATSPEIARAQLQRARPGVERERAEGAVRLSRYYEASAELAARLTKWSASLEPKGRKYTIATGGGPGIMEAANRGAGEAGGQSAGLGISVPRELGLNRFVTPSLGFEFHYFFMRKYWFVYLARAVVAFPGGLGTLDEVVEVMTLLQTGKMSRPLPVVLFGSEFWGSALRFDELLRWGTIAPDDLSLFKVCDTVDEAFEFIVGELDAQDQGRVA